jgi:hypothetical protein
MGNYDNIYSWTSGTMIADSNVSPQGDAANKNIDPSVFGPLLPALRQSSDVICLRWLAVTGSHGQNVGSLQHVFRTNIINSDTIDLVQYVLNGGVVDGWANRATFTPSPGEADAASFFYALLNAVNLSGVAWMLIQHKGEMGLKYIDSISIFTEQFGSIVIYIHVAD